MGGLVQEREKKDNLEEHRVPIQQRDREVRHYEMEPENAEN